MKVLDAGHRYELDSLDGGNTQVLQFVKRIGEKYPGNSTSSAGTNCQEALRALIERSIYIEHQQPNWQTKLSIWMLSAVIWLYEHRAAKRHGRKSPGFHEAVWGSTCKKCGHVGCTGSCH